MSRLFVLFATLAVTLGALAQSASDQHVVFDNSLADGGYYYSDSHVVAPSRLELFKGKFPVEAKRFVSPPNGLRLKWRSAPGGDWRMTLKVPARYARKFEFQGDTLSFWCFADTELTETNSPRISLQDSAGVGAPTIALVRGTNRLAPGNWTNVRLPFADFTMMFNGTDDTKFDPRRLTSINFVQGLDDGRDHTLFLDDFQVVSSKAVTAPPAAPTSFAVQAQERHFDLTWEPMPDTNVVSYRIHRSVNGRDFTPIATRPANYARAVDWVGRPGQAASYRVSAVDVTGQESPLSSVASGQTRKFNDAELLGMVQAGCFRYYWELAHPVAGLAPEIVPGDRNLIATGGNGFGLMALTVATERGSVTRDAAVERLLKAVRFLARADRFHGIWPHFLDGNTGKAVAYFGKYDNGGDLVETAFLMQGLLAARQYFDHDTAPEREIRETITRLWHEAEWDWYRRDPDSEVLYWHWSPDHGFHISHPLIGWNETLIVYLLAIASPTHAVPASLYHTGWAGQSERAVQYRRNWSRTLDGSRYTNGNSYYGIPLAVGEGNGAELFFTQFSFLGFDPRGIRDAYANYFDNNRAIARINHAYCVDNPRRHVGYGPDCWGLSAGINAGGGRPLPRDDNGTINCMAALGAMPYTPKESLAALKHFYRDLGGKVWGAYGFHDGFNATQNWFEEVYMALNQAPITVMIENHRTGLVWNRFMANPEIRQGLDRIGFRRE
jgi:hypothetical protein